MINYSIVMRSVNANLIDINKAKGRINAALAAGEQPAQEDLDLVATETQKAYAIAQYAEVMDIAKLAKHISSHGCVYSRADITAILNMTVDCIREQLLEGRKIRLGEMGDFSLSLESKGADSAEKFNAQNITAVNVTWECGPEFKNLIADAEFNLVASRAAQAAVLKAVKAGETVVDLSKPTGNDDDDNDDNPGGGTPSGGGSQTSTKYTITAQPYNSAYGTVTGSGTFSSGSRIELKATPKSGYKFTQWNDGDTNATRQVTVNANKSYTATFVADSAGGGSTDPSNGSGTDESGGDQSSVPEF